MFIDIVFQSGEFVNQNHKTLFDYLPILLSLVALYFSFKSYYNFDAKKTFITSRVKAVIDFQEVFERTRFAIRVYENGSAIVKDSVPLSIYDELISDKERFKSLFPNFPLVINFGNYLHIDFFKYQDSYLLPKSVKKEIIELTRIESSTMVDLETFGNHILITPLLLPDPDSEYPELKTSGYPNVTIQKKEWETFENFVKQILRIKTEVNDFLNKYDINE